MTELECLRRLNDVVASPLTTDDLEWLTWFIAREEVKTYGRLVPSQWETANARTRALDMIKDPRELYRWQMSVKLRQDERRHKQAVQNGTDASRAARMRYAHSAKGKAARHRAYLRRRQRQAQALAAAHVVPQDLV